jgi:hypothetical protein
MALASVVLDCVSASCRARYAGFHHFGKTPGLGVGGAERKRVSKRKRIRPEWR